MESHCMVTRSQTKSNSGEDKLKTQQTPHKTGAHHTRMQTRSVKKNILVASSEKNLKRKTSSPKQDVATDSVLDRISSNHIDTIVETTSTMNNITRDKDEEMCKNNIKQQTEIVKIPIKRKWIEENEGSTSDEVFEESKTSNNGTNILNNKELLKRKLYVLLTPVRECVDSLTGTDPSFDKNSMDWNDDTKNKACDSDNESVHSCEELKNSPGTGSSEPQISRKASTPYNLLQKEEEFVVEESCVNCFESGDGSSVGEVLHKETDNDLNELSEKHVTPNSSKFECLIDEIESKVTEIAEHTSPVKKDAEKIGEDITCQNVCNTGNALNKVESHIQVTDELKTYRSGLCEEEKIENLLDNVKSSGTRHICETKFPENGKKRELVDALHCTENHKKLECTEELMVDVPVVDTYKKIVSESSENEKKESLAVTQFVDSPRKCEVVSHGEENPERTLSDVQHSDNQIIVSTELFEGQKLETSFSLSKNIPDSKDKDEHSRKNANQNKIVPEENGYRMLESEFQKLQKEELQTENNTHLSVDEIKYREVNTDISGNGIRNVAACDENSDTNELAIGTDPKMQDSQSSLSKGCKKNNEESYSSVKSANTNDSVPQNAIQINTERISLLEEKCIKNSEEETKKLDTLLSNSIETSSNTDHGECTVSSSKHITNLESVSSCELQLRNINAESQLCGNKQCIPENDLTDDNKICCLVAGQQSSDAVIEERKDVSFKQSSKIFCKSKQSNDNTDLSKTDLSQVTSVGLEMFPEKLQTCVQKTQEKIYLLETPPECSRTENKPFKNPVSESLMSFQTGSGIMPICHYNRNNFVSNKTVCHCQKGSTFNCVCNKMISDHGNVHKHSENIIVNRVIPLVNATIDNYFHTVELNGKHVETLKKQIQNSIRSVTETVQHTSRLHILPDTLFNKKHKNKKEKNKRNNKNESLDMQLKEGKNQYFKKSKQQNEGKKNKMKETENNDFTEHERKKIKLKHEMNKDAKTRSNQFKNTASNEIAKSVPYDVFRLPKKEIAQTARSRQMSGDVNIKGEEGYRTGTGQDINKKNISRIKHKIYENEQLRSVKVMKVEKKITSGKNVFTVCRSDNINKDKQRGNFAESRKKVRKVKYKFQVGSVSVPRDNHVSNTQPMFQKNCSFTASRSDSIRKDIMKPECTENLKKVTGPQHNFKVETVNIPSDKHAQSYKPVTFQKDRVFSVYGNNNVSDETNKKETKKDLGLKRKFNVRTSNKVDGKLKSSSGEFTFQFGNKTAHENGILEPIRPFDNKSKEYLSALQEVKWNQASTSGLNIFNPSAKCKISKHKAVANKGSGSANKSSIKKLPEELLEAVSQNVQEQKSNRSKDSLSEFNTQPRKRKKKLKLKSAVLEDGYIPLNTNSATQFVVARLDKNTTLSAAEKAVQFKQNCLYGPHIKRAPVKREYVMQKLCLADDHYKDGIKF